MGTEKPEPAAGELERVSDHSRVVVDDLLGDKDVAIVALSRHIGARWFGLRPCGPEACACHKPQGRRSMRGV